MNFWNGFYAFLGAQFSEVVFALIIMAILLLAFFVASLAEKIGE